MESKAVETDAIAAEQDSQTAYEGFVKKMNKSIATLKATLASQTETVAKADSDLALTKADLLASLDTIEDLSTYSGEIHTSCDYTLKNFDVRQQSRSTEIDAL